MSSQTKDPLEKQDTPSESSGSHSDSEVNLDHLKIEEQQAKDEIGDDSKPLDSPNQEGSSTNKDYLLDEPIAGSSGLQKPFLGSSDDSSYLDSKEIGISSPSEEETKEVAEIFGDKMVEGDSNTTDNSPLFKQTSTGSVVIPPPIPERKLPAVNLHKFGMAASPANNPLLKRGMFAIGSANTSSDVSEIRSEVADLSTEGSIFLDAPESFEKDDSPSVYEPAVESPSSEASDANISDLPDESIITTSSSSSLSVSTPSGEQGHQAYLAMLEREANERGVPISTSSGIGSTNQSELANLQRWGLAGEMGNYRPNLDDIIDYPNQEASEGNARGEEPQAAPESVQDEPILEVQRMQDSDSLFPEEQLNRDTEDANVVNKSATQRQKDEETMETSDSRADLTPAKKKSLSHSSDSSREENIIIKLKPRIKPDIRKKEKMIASTSGVKRQSSSESPEPKSSSSDEIRRKDSPDIRSSSGTPDELSEFDKGKKLWQKPGQLRNMQLLTVVPKDSVITEEDEEQISPLESQDPELKESKNVSPEKMEITAEKDLTKMELSESKSSLESKDQASGSEIEATLPVDELSCDASGFERTVGKSKRPGTKLSTSPPSDEITSSTPPKEGTSRPKKKARADKKQGKPCKTRHDSGGSAGTAVKLERPEQDDNTSTTDTSDYTASDEELEEEETEL